MKIKKNLEIYIQKLVPSDGERGILLALIHSIMTEKYRDGYIDGYNRAEKESQRKK